MLTDGSGAPRCAVLGSPIAHSLSPAAHRAAYAALGLDTWTYEAVDVDEATLPGFVAGLGTGWRGLSLTMPLKRAVLPLLDDVHGVARDLRIVNTVVVRDGGLHGHNTDVPGVSAALAAQWIPAPRTLRVLGAGATATAVLHSLGPGTLEHVEVVVRDPARSSDLVALAERLGARTDVRTLDDPTGDAVDLLVSTVPAAATADTADERVAAAGAVLDVVYDPWPPPLTRAASAAGVPVASGPDLLVHQAALQVALMTGETVEPSLLLAAVEAELASR